MSEFLLNTAEEADGTGEQKTTGLVVYVLQYDQLAVQGTTVLPPFSSDGRPIVLGRAEKVGPPRLDASDPSCQTFLLSDSFVSRQHALVVRREGAEYVRDLGSKHGTYVNGERVVSEQRLVDGDLIEVGHSLFVYRYLTASVAARSIVQQQGLAFGPTRTFSPEVMTLVHKLRGLATTTAPILIVGETGVGKEIAATFVHEKSGRKGALVAVDCGAIAPQLLESELFGHTRGAYTGSMGPRAGRIRMAEGGTLFLDELGNLPQAAQSSLLRVLETCEVIPVGADQGEKVDVRWVAATNADLFAPDARFRSDLRERLSGYVARLPPLRNRLEDLGVLAAHFLAKAGIKRASITKQAARLWFGGPLAGNVRGLEKALSTGAVLAGDGPMDIEHLSVLAMTSLADGEARERDDESGVDPQSAGWMEVETYRRKRPSKEVLEAVLQKTGRVQSEAARLLQTSEKQLARWMDAHAIPRARKG